MRVVAVLLLTLAVISLSQIAIVWSPIDEVVAGWSSTLDKNDTGMYTISQEQLNNVKLLAELTEQLKSEHDRTFLIISIFFLIFGVLILTINRQQQKKYNQKLQNIQAKNAPEYLN